MTPVQILALSKVAFFGVLLVVVLRDTRWRFLTGALVVAFGSNVATVCGASRLVTSLIGELFLVLLALHVFDVSQYRKPDKP